MKKRNSLPKAISFACVALFLVGTAVVEAANSALVVTCDERADVLEDDGFAFFLDRLNDDGWSRWRIPAGRAATYANVVAVVDSFIDEIEVDSNAMVALKGRVVETDGVVYFLPEDAKTTESNAIPLSDVVDKLENSSAKRCYLAVDECNDNKTIDDKSFHDLETSKVRVLRGNLCDAFDKINDDQLPPQDGVDQEVPNDEETGSEEVGAENQDEQTAEVDVCSSDEPISPPQCVDSEGVDNNLTVKAVDDTIRSSSSVVLEKIANAIADDYEHDRFIVVPTFATDPEKRLIDALLPLSERLAKGLDENLAANGFCTHDFDEIQTALFNNAVRIAPSPTDADFERLTTVIRDAVRESVDLVAYGRLELVANDAADGVAVTVTVFDASTHKKRVYKGAFKADDVAKADLVGLSSTLSDDDMFSLVMPSWDDIATAETEQQIEASVKPALLDPEFDYHVSICVRDAEVANSAWKNREIVQDGVENVLLLDESETFAVRVRNNSGKNVCARVIVDNKGTLPMYGGSEDFAPIVDDVTKERSWFLKSGSFGSIDGFYYLSKGTLKNSDADTDIAAFKNVNRTDADVEYHDVYPGPSGNIYIAIYDSAKARGNDVENVAIIPDKSNITHRRVKITDQAPKGNVPIAVLNIRVKFPSKE